MVCIVVTTIVSELALGLECNLPHLEMEGEVVEYCCGTAVVQTEGQSYAQNPPTSSAHTLFLVSSPDPPGGGSGNETNSLSCMYKCKKVGLSGTEFTQIHLFTEVHLTIGTWGRVTFTFESIICMS